jgi:hypothetical protein
MVKNSQETQAVLSFLALERDKILALVGTPLSRPVFNQFRLRFFSAVKAKFPGEDFEDWLRLEVDPTMTRIDVKLNHERMVPALEEVPNWVYFVFWTFNPNFAPTKKENYDTITS